LLKIQIQKLKPIDKSLISKALSYTEKIIGGIHRASNVSNVVIIKNKLKESNILQKAK